LPAERHERDRGECVLGGDDRHLLPARRMCRGTPQLPADQHPSPRELLRRHSRHPASCSLHHHPPPRSASNAAADRAIAEPADGFALAESGTIVPSMAVISGRDPRYS
jgi:hypothetical protein